MVDMEVRENQHPDLGRIETRPLHLPTQAVVFRVVQTRLSAAKPVASGGAGQAGVHHNQA